MNKNEEVKKAKEKYEMSIRQIEMADEIIKKIEPLLPNGWEGHFYLDGIFPIIFQSGTLESKRENRPQEEFKLVCKLVEGLVGRKLSKEAMANDKWGLYKLEGFTSYYQDKVDLSIKVSMYNPSHNCEIRYEKEEVGRYVVSSDCLEI